MVRKPFFSVVMPTRNRASLLPTAIRSVLGQTFEDFELIVSDNQSDDNTREVVESFQDPRIKYFRTSDFLTINNSWASAVGHATGEYVAFLCDDDAYGKVYLEAFKTEIDSSNLDLAACGMPQYYEHPHYESAYKLTAPRFTNAAQTIDCFGREETVFRYMFAKGGLTTFPDDFDPVGLPYLSNGVYRREIFLELKQRLGSVFPRDLASTDVYSSTIILSQFTKRYAYIDKPLYIQRVSDVSLTRSPDIEKQKKTYGRPSHDLGRFNSYFVDFSYSNLWVEACLLAAADTGFEIDFELNWAKYYLKAYDSLMYLQDRGFDMRAEIASFFGTVERQSKSIRDEVLPVVNSPRARFSRFLRTSKAARPLLKMRQRAEPQVDEGMVGLNDELTIDEYAARLDDEFLEKYARQGVTI